MMNFAAAEPASVAEPEPEAVVEPPVGEGGKPLGRMERAKLAKAKVI